MSDMRQMDDDLEAERRRVAARIRAAMTYSGKSSRELVDEHADVLTLANLRRMCFVDNPRAASSLELAAIAQGTGVPLDWLERGWEHNGSKSVAEQLHVELGGKTLSERVANLERAQELAQRTLAALVTAEASRGRREPPPPPSAASPAPRSRRAKSRTPRAQ